jgi:hypothetical protein
VGEKEIRFEAVQNLVAGETIQIKAKIMMCDSCHIKKIERKLSIDRHNFLQ